MDARIPVSFGCFGDPLPPDTAVLVEGHAAFPGGAVATAGFMRGNSAFAGCACCAPRGPAVQALSRLFLARARGEVAFFRRVVVVASDEAEIRAAIAGDVVVSARYRVEPA